jgi:hypothetical protein
MDSRGIWTGASIRGGQGNNRRFERRGYAVAVVDEMPMGERPTVTAIRLA